MLEGRAPWPLRPGFRWRLLLWLLAAVSAGSVFDALADNAERWRGLPAQVEAELASAEAFARAAVAARGGVLSLPGAAPSPPEGTRVRVLRGDEVLLAASALGPAPELALRLRPLTPEHVLELAVDRGAFERAVRAELARDLTDDLPGVAVSALVAWLLAGWLLRPLRTIAEALDALSRRPSPEADPLPVPSGDDLIAQLARSFNRLSAAVQAAFERERAFTRYASHELRTPLSALKLQLESLELGLSPPETVFPAVERNLERMGRVLEALLSLARSSEKDQEPVALDRLVRESLELLPVAAQARVALTSCVSPSLRVASPYLLGQCILNLVDNALKYTAGEVTVRLEPAPRGAVVRVCDHGGGVPEALLDRLTHTFFRFSNTAEGSGLGLAFVKHIVRTLGGELSLRNAEGGLEVALALPAVRGA